MGSQSGDPETERLLAELRSDDAARRIAAAQRIAERGMAEPELVAALQAITRADHFEVRRAAERALAAIESSGAPVLRNATAPPAPGQTLSRPIKIIHFAIGFAGWYLLNGLVWLSFGGQVFAPGSDMIILNAVVFPGNVVALIVLVRAARWMGWGMLTAVALNLLIALILGAGMAGVCFIPFFVR